MREKTADELRRWRNPGLKAFKNFINVVRNKAVNKLTADDMLIFREWLSCLAPYIRPLIFGFSNKVSGTGGFMFRAW